MLNATYSVTSEPSVEPITLEELKNRLRITTNDFDSELSDLLTAARRQVEHDSHRRLITQTLTLTLDRFPAGNAIEVRQLPVQSVSSVQYVDDDEATATFASSKYTVDTTTEPARIVLKSDESWETTEEGYPGAVIVTFVAGYGATATTVPVEAKLAMVEWVRMHWGDCDGDSLKYRNLIAKLAWSALWKPV